MGSKVPLMLRGSLILAATAIAPHAVAQQAAYKPDLAELMAVTQFRHYKVGYSAEVENWDLTKYELGKIRNSLETASSLYPTFQNVDMAQLIQQISNPALDAMDKAVAAKDRRKFKAEFAKLTDACNSCHQQTGVGFIKIRVPTKSPHSNQVLEPKK
jgi:hypothetical protein